MPNASISHLERRLRSQLRGEAYFDSFSRGRYATDASVYQMMPIGVVLPRDLDDIRWTLQCAAEAGVPILPRGAGTSQCGQTVNHALVIDTSKYLHKIVKIDPHQGYCRVQPGVVLDELNQALKPHGLWFPVDVSTASRATLGGMAANNSAGSRSIRYGMMRDNVRSIHAMTAAGELARFGKASIAPALDADNSQTVAELKRELLCLGEREADEIMRRFPSLMRRVGGYNIDALVPQGAPNNFAHLLVGSEGTLAYFSELELDLALLPQHKVLGVCHFKTFYAAMDAAQHLVKLGPTAVELIDSTMISLARDIPLYRETIKEFVRGDPAALLLVEFAEPEQRQNIQRLKQLSECMADLGFAWSNNAAAWGGVLEAVDPNFQAAIFEVRKAGLNIMMSMKDEGKPVSFVEDCAVELPHLADYTAQLTEIFSKYGTRGTWYAHASVGCLHVRPVLNLKLDTDVKKMRAIAEEAFELVRKYRGSHSGEHGDGIVRSEFHATMFGERMVAAFAEVKQYFDPNSLFNPGKIVSAPRMDNRSLFRYPPDYRVPELNTAMDWSSWSGAGGGFQGAVEMCNNNGACRKLRGGAMCPSYRVTRNEQDVTRGRANILRLAISGQLGANALTSAQMQASLKLCVSCKACKRECPTGVDMARMKLEVAIARAQTHGISWHDQLVAWLPRYAPFVSRIASVGNLRDQIPGLARLLQSPTGFTAHRRLPRWRRDIYRAPAPAVANGDKKVVLFADTFNTYFEPENLRAAYRVLNAAGYQVIAPLASNVRPLCCGRTFLNAGLIDEARHEISRCIEACIAYVRQGVPVVGIEPSCLYTLRDEFKALFPGEDTDLLAQQAWLLEEFIEYENPQLNYAPLSKPAILHGHCHQKAFGGMTATQRVLARIPGLQLTTVDSSCCGMAGAFGYHQQTYTTSMQMAELSLLPAVRMAPMEALVVADGFSCRHQIYHGSGRHALHASRLLAQALDRAALGS